MTRMKSSKLALILSIMLFCEMHDASAQRYRYQAAQRYNYDDEESIFFFGIGTGLDYGGLGVKIEGIPTPYLGIFGGVGYNFRGLGLNGGLSFKALPSKKLSPTIQAMYGYNAVIVVKELPEYSKTYYGPSVGAGLEWKLGRKPNKLSFAIYYPIRSDQYHKDIDDLKANPMIKFENEPLPITFSIGFNFGT